MFCRPDGGDGGGHGGESTPLILKFRDTAQCPGRRQPLIGSPLLSRAEQLAVPALVLVAAALFVSAHGSVAAWVAYGVGVGSDPVRMFKPSWEFELAKTTPMWDAHVRPRYRLAIGTGAGPGGDWAGGPHGNWSSPSPLFLFLFLLFTPRRRPPLSSPCTMQLYAMVSFVGCISVGWAYIKLALLAYAWCSTRLSVPWRGFVLQSLDALSKFTFMSVGRQHASARPSPCPCPCPWPWSWP